MARHSASDGPDFSIETPALRQAVDYVRGFLRSPETGTDQPDASGTGHVIAVVGEYGTGKTHLTVEVLRQVLSGGDETVHTLYVDAPADTFLALYKERFFRKLDKADVRRRVTEYYADIVADELTDSPLTSDAARLLRERQLSPQDVVRRLGLRESTFLQELQARLGHITEHADFGTALALFLRPEFEAAVWEWLAGHPADPALKERGVERTIDNDISALEAIGVFAFLYGRQGHRFVLAVDEFEKVLSRGTRSARHEGSVLAFKKLLEVFAQTRSLLILSGLPDFMEILPPDAQQRISCLVRPTALSFEDARQYIRYSLGRSGTDAGLRPFSDEVIAYLVELAGGNARKVIRLCYHAYQAGAAAGTDITRAMIREVARDQFEVSSPQDVRAEIVRVLDSGGWAFEPDHRLGEDDGTQVTFWLPVGDNGTGLGVVVTQSILNEEEALRVAQQGEQVLAATTASSFVVLVVNGYLAGQLADTVTSEFARVFTYSPRRFPEDFAAAVKGFMQRLEATFNDDRISLIENRMAQLMRQTSSVRGSLDEMGSRLTSPAMLERAVARGVQRAFGAAAGTMNAQADISLPPTVALRFRQSALELQTWREALETSVDALFDGSDDPYGPPSVHTSLTRALGALYLQERTLSGFRDAVNRLLDRTPEERHRAASDSLGQLCSTYDRLTDGNADMLEQLGPLNELWQGAHPTSRGSLADRNTPHLLVLSLRSLARDVYDLCQSYYY
ncbi:hypothetical protein BU52_03250 [Streptomyces toyocaensis]|uniref:AAA+ ATPase domain-containing protein n=1 Tax=Streptomyces toyocaensis TaxID=55952 RepID=A0A081XZV7_STRTO|nr:hypothetical protein BU52_03250 [Streptomyces toyocaensis]